MTNPSKTGDVKRPARMGRDVPTRKGEAFMRKTSLLLSLIAVVALAVPAFAGEGHKCTAPTQECLNKMSAKLKTHGWVGIEMDKSKKGGAMAVTRVVPGSSAE